MKPFLINLWTIVLICMPCTAWGFEAHDLARLKQLHSEGKICEAAMVASKCLQTKTVSPDLDACLHLGDRVASGCLDRYLAMEVTQLAREGKQREAEEAMSHKFDQLKLEKGFVTMQNDGLFVQTYTDDYVRKHVLLFKRSPHREEYLFRLIRKIWLWDSEQWEGLVADFEREFSESKSRNTVNCLLAQHSYMQWVHGKKLDYRKTIDSGIRTDGRSSEAKQLQAKSLKLFRDLKSLKSAQGLLSPCDSLRFDRAIQQLTGPDLPTESLMFFTLF